MRASRYPRYWDFNLVRVERECEMNVDQLIALADHELRGLPHRRLDFDLARWAEPLRAAFEARGWVAERLLWMRHQGERASTADTMRIREVPYEQTEEMRSSWHREDFPGRDEVAYRHEAREVALRRQARVVAIFEGGTPVGFAQLESRGARAEVTQVYVYPMFRGNGRGTAITAAAIAAAGEVEDLWICADESARAKHLYARLGFVPIATVMQLTRLP
jgi:GNAT superfamily N-acetyltransferase